MSAEGKKKHGTSGVSNAKNIAFRYGGKPSNLSIATGRAQRFGGSRFLNAVRLGMMLPGYVMSTRAENAGEEIIERNSAPIVVELMNV